MRTPTEDGGAGTAPTRGADLGEPAPPGARSRVVTPRPASVHRVPFADLAPMTQEVRQEVEASFARVLDSGRFIGGEVVERFEHDWAAYCRTRQAVGVGNGTDALQLALRGLGIGPGDEVVVPANSFVATVEAVVLAGATPRFADVAPDSLLMSAATLEAALTPRTRAVIVVHLYGQVADMDAVGRVAAASGLVVVEDAAQAHGATWRGRPAGSLGHAGCFSFYPGKNLGAFGDAGAVVTDDEHLARRIRSMRDHGRAPGSHYEHPLPGTNSRMDALQAAVLSVKLPRLAGWTAARRARAEQYRRELAGGPVRLVDDLSGGGHVYHLLVARVAARDRVRAALAAAGIETSLHYPTPSHLQPPYAGWADGPLPVTEAAAAQILSLPMYPHLTTAQVTRVCDVLGAVVAGEVADHVA
ncbi:DegT/DnrJ/EryC1/StrS family aminotransferase [Modestobacter sp. URMC 112]